MKLVGDDLKATFDIIDGPRTLSLLSEVALLLPGVNSILWCKAGILLR